MEYIDLSYREVIPDQTNAPIHKDISLNTGSAQSTLQDIKVIEKAGGFCYSDDGQTSIRNRFIYWRTNANVLELSEISLDVNLIDSAIRYTFADAPILAVSIEGAPNGITVLVATVSSVHLLRFTHPDALQKNVDDTLAYSIFHAACNGLGTRDTLFHIIGHSASSNQPTPHTAACSLSEDKQDAYFAIAYQSAVMLYKMTCATGQTISMELKESNIVPRILTNLTGAFRGRNADSYYATSMVFNVFDDVIYLAALYRDDHVRTWSTKNGQCVGALNCMTNQMDTRSRGSQNNLLRKASSGILCAYLCNTGGSEFVLIRMTHEQGALALQKVDSIPSPKFDLIEFDVNTSRIWGLWCNSQGEFKVCSYAFQSNGDCTWSSAGLETLPERKIESGCDPRHTYCSYIFYPGRFQRDVIDRALKMFRRSNILSDPNVTMAVLKDRVCYAIETEVQTSLKDYDVTDELYLEMSFKAWERFYSCCEQYHITSTQPIGLVNLGSIDAVAVIKKNAYSLLRPCELLEHMMLAGENVNYQQLCTLAWDDDVSVDDLIRLIGILSVIERNISDEYKAEIDTKLYELNAPNEIIAHMMTEYRQDFVDPESLFNINEMEFVATLPKTMILLLKMLQMTDGDLNDSPAHTNMVQTSRHFLSAANLFRSTAGISLIAESLHQIAVIRYVLCRNLLILQQILVETDELAADTLEFIRSNCIPETVIFVRAYYVMIWICETAENQPSSGALDASIQHLSVLQLSDCRYKQRLNYPTTLLEQFLRGKGLQAGLWSLLGSSPVDVHEVQWKNTLLPLVNSIGQLLWAVDGSFIFGEWLIGSCQHTLVQEYVRLLNCWCEWNENSRHFIAAVSFLDNGEPYKAYDLFMQSAKGIQQESYLERIVSPMNEEYTANEAIAQFYLKVILLFEEYASRDCIIQLAKATIDELAPSSGLLAMFQSIVFTNHLNLEHYEEAYHALTANTEPARRKDCLRQLVVRLFEKRRLDLLLKFPYLGLQVELENIVESRARSMSIEDNVYYDFLFAFYMSRSTVRKAASVMYVQALRCMLEFNTLPGVERRYECLLACITALELAEENYRWIARPVISEDQQDVSMNDDDMEVDRSMPESKIVVLDIHDIRKELLLTEAIITLAKHRKELNTIVNADANELIAILSNAGLYTDAVKLAKEFGRTIGNILQSLAFACIRTTDENSNDAWTWLQENDIADLPQKDSPSDMSWMLLNRLIKEHEEADSTDLHKAVANKVLSLGEFLPHWLFLSYRQRNPAELLNLYVTHGRLVEATDLAKEFIAAMINTGGEYFGLRNAMHSTLPPLCFPINTIDTLLRSLKLNRREDEEYATCYDELNHSVDQYMQLAERVSVDRIQFLRLSDAAR